MWINAKSGSVVAGNVTKEPEYKRVGNNNTPLYKISIAVGEDDSGEKKYVEIAAWGRLADKLNALDIQKADPIAAFGIWTKRENKGKTYWTLKADFVMAYPGGCVDIGALSGGVPKQDENDLEFGDMPDFMK